MWNKKDNITKRGFTLIELLGTIGVIALLTTVTFFIINSISNNSKEFVNRINEETLTNAAIIYAKEFKLSEQQWYDESELQTKFTCLSIGQLKNKGILKGKLVDATTGIEFDYNTVIKVKKDLNSVIINEIEKDSNDCDKVVPSVKITIDGNSYDIDGKKWYTDDVSYRIEPTTGFSGVSEYNYFFEINGTKREIEKGTTSKIYEGQFNDSGSNVKICAEVISGSGITSGKICESVNIDNITPSVPTIVSSDNKNSGAWHGTAFSLNVNSAQKSLSGTEYYYGYSSNNINVLAVNGKINVTESENNKKIYVIACSKVKKCSNTVEYDVKVDTTIPTVTLVANEKTSGTVRVTNTWSTEGLNFTLTQGSVGSSGATIYYCKDTANTCNPTTKATSGSAITSYNTTSGTYYIRYKIVSGSGRASNIAVYTAKVDTTTPTVTLVAKEKTSGTVRATNTWSTEGLNFTLTQGSVGSSGATIYYCKDTANTCSPNTKATSGSTITSYNAQTGTYYIRYKIVSGAGKTSSVGSYTAKVEIIPIITIGSDIRKYKYESYDLWNGVSVSGPDILEKMVIINGNTVTNTNQLDVGNHIATYQVQTFAGNIARKNRNIEILNTKKTYKCVENEDVYVVPITGYYSIIANGAQGSNNGGKGGKVYGKMYFTKGDVLKINVGCMTGYNGGGISRISIGGGATTIEKDSNYILIAGGGGGSLDSRNVNTLTEKSQGGAGDGYGEVRGINGGGGTSTDFRMVKDGETCTTVPNPDYSCTSSTSTQCTEYKTEEKCTTRQYCTRYETPACGTSICPICVSWADGETTCKTSTTCVSSKKVTTTSCNSETIKDCSPRYVTINGVPGHGGASSVISEYKGSFSFVSGQQKGDGNLTIEYVGATK